MAALEARAEGADQIQKFEALAGRVGLNGVAAGFRYWQICSYDIAGRSHVPSSREAARAWSAYS